MDIERSYRASSLLLHIELMALIYTQHSRHHCSSSPPMSQLHLFRLDLSQTLPHLWAHAGLTFHEDRTDASAQRRIVCLPVAHSPIGAPLGYIATPELGELDLSDLDQLTIENVPREELTGRTSDQTNETRVFRALLVMAESWRHPSWTLSSTTEPGVQDMRAFLLQAVTDFGMDRLSDEAATISREAARVWVNEGSTEEEKLSAVRHASSALSNRYLFVKTMRALDAETYKILEVCSELEGDLMERLPDIRASEAGAHRTTVLPKCTAGSGCQVISHLSDEYCVAYRAAVMDLCDQETPDW